MTYFGGDRDARRMERKRERERECLGICAKE
jgi:hypothetical protein